MRLNQFLSIAAVAAAAVSGSFAFAQSPIKFVVGYPAGGSSDALARMIADKLKDETGTEPVTGVKEYQAILRAQKVLKEKEILEMVQDAVDNGTAEQKGLSLAAILSNIEINKYRLRQ